MHTLDKLDHMCRETSLLRVLDAIARGDPVCVHVRDDGLGFCGDGPNDLSHWSGNRYRHDFKPFQRGAGRLSIARLALPAYAESDDDASAALMAHAWA